MDDTTRPDDEPTARQGPTDPGGTAERGDLDDDTGDQRTGGPARRFTRRQVLTMAGATGLVGAGVATNWFVLDDDPASSRRTAADGSPTTQGTAATGDAAPSGARWSDPATWGGEVPAAGDLAVIDKPVLLDVDAAVAGVRIEAGGELTFDPAASRTLTSTGNVAVAGTLRARPESADVHHVVVFEGIDESGVEGGNHSHEPVESDVGLWVLATGVLDVLGTPKRAWTTLTGPAEAGATSITVADASGWQEGDEVVVTPTEPTTVEGFAEHYDRRVVAAVDGSTIELDDPLEFPHPAVTVRPDVTHHAEVLNLTRNVRVEGTPDGRAHVMLLGVGGAQTFSYVGLRHMGPQAPHPDGDGVRGVLGRYALHLHRTYEAAHGTEIEGVVAYDGGNHAFVPHLSDGITFRDCIAHDLSESAFWWDQAAHDAENDHVPTNDLVYDRCVASLVRPTADSEYDASGFVLGPGQGSAARGCVAVGMVGDDTANPGFRWRADAHEAHPWVFEDCLSHNNNGSSIYFWVNGVPPSSVDRFTAYHDRHGIRAGAYTNLVSYRDCTVYACDTVGLAIDAVPGSEPDDGPDVTITYEDVYVDQAGRSEYAVIVSEHVVAASRPTRMTGCHFAGGTKAQVGFPEPGEYPQLYELTDCTYDGNAFWLAGTLTEVVDIVVRDDVHGAIALRPNDQQGERRSAWNARVTSV